MKVFSLKFIAFAMVGMFPSPFGVLEMKECGTESDEKTFIGYVSVPFRGFGNERVSNKKLVADANNFVSVPFRDFGNESSSNFLLPMWTADVSVPFRGFGNESGTGTANVPAKVFTFPSPFGVLEMKG